MGLTTAMLTGLTGMDVNQNRINTIGNNVANVNTTAFKGSRTIFQTQFYRTFSQGSRPSEITGGTNPIQLGMGASIATTQRNHTGGPLETTGIASDLAIDGAGYFVLRRGANGQAYTRDGSFTTDGLNRLVSADGFFVQGFSVDENFQIQDTVLQDITIPLGSQLIAEQTESVRMDGDLSADGTIATQGSVTQTQQLVVASGASATGTAALTDLRSASNPGAPLFSTGTVITITKVDKGEREVPTRSFTVGTDGNTLDDFAQWLEGALGIQPDEGPGTAGVTIDDGRLTITSNAGSVNGFTFSAGDVRSDNAAAPLPFEFAQVTDANGSGVTTAFTIYDSLGSPVTVNVAFVLEGTPNTGPVWRFYVESPDATGGSRSVGTGTITFDTDGNFFDTTGNMLTLNRDQSGAMTPITFDLDFTGVHGLSTRQSTVIMQDQNGFPPGTLTNYAVNQDGTITGIFDNGQTRSIGQVALAVFPSESGLIAEADNLYTVGPSSGEAVITPPGTFGAGLVIGGTLEGSNVDLAREFIGLITSSTGFQASSRVISTSSDLLNSLLLVLQ